MLNKLLLIGHVGNDFKKTGDDRGYFSLYTPERSINASGDREEITETHIIGVSGKLTKVAEDIVKTGRLFLVEAKLKHVVSKDDNNKKSTRTFINAVFIKMLNKSTKEILIAKAAEIENEKNGVHKESKAIVGNDPFKSNKDVANKKKPKKEIKANKLDSTKIKEDKVKEDKVKEDAKNTEQIFDNSPCEDDDIPF